MHVVKHSLYTNFELSFQDHILTYENNILEYMDG